MPTIAYNNNNSFVVPEGVTEVVVRAWGAGGAGSGRGTSNGRGGGGGGGAFASNQVAVTSGQNWTVTVGAGGTGASGAAGGDGGNTTFALDANTTVRAEGGLGGQNNGANGAGGRGGNLANSIGAVRRNGGNGVTGNASRAGSGGGGAGTNANGATGNNTAAGAGGAVGGGNGGLSVAANASGNPGNNYGGGGSGARRNAGTVTGFNGAPGLLEIEYTVAPAFVLAASAHIAASAADATTQQLSTPDGYTGGDFTAGKLSDDTNPVTVDLGEAEFSEIEWSIAATSDATPEDAYEFRVLVDGSPITSATTPEVTVEEAGVELAPAGAAHSHAADSPTVLAGGTLTVSDASHSHAADSPTVEAGVTLAVADASHSHAAEAPALVQENVLSVDDAGHAHTAEAVALAIPGVPVFGFLGDSQTDSYQSPDAGPESSGMGPPHEHVTPGGPGGVLNWLEILVHAARLNPGAWGSFSEPRRFDFAYNWSRSGAVMSEVIADQLAGLAAQVAAGTVTHSAIFATGNDWLNPADGLLYAPDIYGGNGTQTQTGTPLSTLTASIVAQFVAIMDAIDAALDTAESGGGMVVMTPQDYLKAPPAWDPFPDPTRRGYVTGVIEAIHAGVVAYASGLNSAAGYTRFAVIRSDHYLLDVWGTASGDFLTISGAQVDMSEGWEYGEVYDPYLLTIAPTTSSVSHAGTLMGGEYARAFLAAANQIPGVAIAPLTDAEILRAAGLIVLEVADAAHGHVADSPDLTQHVALSVDGASHQHGADSPALEQASVLEVAGAVHDHVAESPVLSAGVTLAPADASHSHAAESPALVQANVLAVDAAAHSHGAESPALSQGLTLAVDDAAHAHVADAPALTQAGTLAVADAAHDHAADSPALIEAARLTVADAAHSHDAESPAIVPAGSLVIDDASHGHAADAPALSQAHVLAILGAAHTHSADSPSLEETVRLVVADATHDHSAESPALSLGWALAIAEALHAHTADEPVLTQAHLLAVAGASHLHGADSPPLGLPITPLQRTRAVSADNRAVSVSQNPRTRRVNP